MQNIVKLDHRLESKEIEKKFIKKSSLQKEVEFNEGVQQDDSEKPYEPNEEENLYIAGEVEKLRLILEQEYLLAEEQSKAKVKKNKK